MSLAGGRQSRKSIFPQQNPTDAFWTSLNACAIALHATSTSLNSAITTLHQGTFDFPRLELVLTTRRAFEVVTEEEVAAAQRDLASEIEPQIKELIDRAEAGLATLKQRERSLRARVDKRAAVAASAARATRDSERAEEDEIRLLQLRRRKQELSVTGNRLDADIAAARKRIARV